MGLERAAGRAGTGAAAAEAAATGGRTRRRPFFRRVGFSMAVVAILAAVLGLDSVWPAGFVYAAVGAAVVAVAMDEYCRLGLALDVPVQRRLLVVSAVALFLLQWAGWASAAFPAPWLSGAAFAGLLVMALLCGRVARSQVEGALQGVSFAALGLLYVPILLGFLTAIRFRFGLGAFVATIVVCKGGTTGAYLAGTTLGRVKLSPVVSPNKTVEGAVGCVLASMGLACALSLSPWPVMGPEAALVFGFVVAITAMFGDLAESLLKREASVKDSGQVVPHNGGMLDMVDDLLFVAPVSYVFFSACSVLAAGG